MSVVVVSQPMFLPWIGAFDQIRLADVFVHYDDVQMPQGRSFSSRVQLPTAQGSRWMTAPVDRAASGRMINEVVLQEDPAWRQRHLESLRHTYARAPQFAAMFDLAREIYAQPTRNLARFNATAVELIAGRIGLAPRWTYASDLGIGGASTARLVEICAHYGARTYLTGHGASRYMDHDAFETRGIAVAYMGYDARPWPQITPDFTPYVTVLDLLAQVPFDAVQDHMAAVMTPWRAFLAAQDDRTKT